MLPKLFASVFLFLYSVCALQAQTDKKSIDQKFFEFDIYPFELAESSSKWGLKFKEVYERTLAVTYLKRNFHYNIRVDTLINNTWLALPFYDKFERWSFGPRFQYMVGTRGVKVDMFTLSGEILGSNVTEFVPEKVNLEKSDVVVTLKTGNQWKWYYEGDFYNKNTTIYYNSPLFDKLEIVRDTVLANFHFITEVQGVKQRFNVVGHELSGNVVAYNEPVQQPVVKEEPVAAQVEKKQDIAAEQKAKKEAEIKAAVAKSLKETEEKDRIAAEQKAAAEATSKADAAAQEIAALKAQLAVEEKARKAAEAKAKSEEEQKNTALKALKEAEQKAVMVSEQKSIEEAKQKAADEARRIAEAATLKAKEEADIKAAVSKALKEAEEKERMAAEQKNAEEAKRIAEAEKAKAAAAKAKAEEDKKAALKALKETEENERVAAEQKAKEEAKLLAEAEKAKKAAEVKSAVEKTLKEVQEKEQLAAEQRAKEESKRIAEAEQLKLAAEVKAAKAEVAVKSADAAGAELLLDRNVIMQKIIDRDKMITYVFYKEKEFFGLKAADGKVLIYPVLKDIKVTSPSNPELKQVNTFATLEINLNGQVYKIIKSDFGGPEKLSCSDGKLLVWNKEMKKYFLAQ